ncbi:hypothetical protein [Helcococcus kunzii]|uniref:hypothetical protein n=1 Tax=Helcococcus kunzii TaxID=40091 RepID=UPI001BAFC363|nr:hypothetical protein [Helcococcus kunzii]QUY65093.1 hypothetical protein GUI37_06005 [Helcococcus kunzii]
MENKEGIIRIDGFPYIHCPVCGTLVEEHDICDKCGYQNSGYGEGLDGPQGPMKKTLRECKELYEKGLPFK